MDIHIYDALVDIERRMQEILQDIRIVKEHSFYSDESYDIAQDSQEQRENERLAAFQHLVEHKK